MQTIDTQLKLIEYLGENPLNISNLPGLLNLKKLGTFFSNSVITWVQDDPPMFQGFSSLLRESGYYVLSENNNLPYTLHNETEVIPSPKNVVSTLQIVSWKCDNKLIADMDSSFFNGVAKIGKLNNNSFTTWQPGIPDMFQGFLSFEKDETYLILSNPSGLPYQLYHCANFCSTLPTTICLDGFPLVGTWLGGGDSCSMNGLGPNDMGLWTLTVFKTSGICLDDVTQTKASLLFTGFEKYGNGTGYACKDILDDSVYGTYTAHTANGTQTVTVDSCCGCEAIFSTKYKFADTITLVTNPEVNPDYDPSDPTSQYYLPPSPPITTALTNQTWSPCGTITARIPATNQYISANRRCTNKINGESPDWFDGWEFLLQGYTSHPCDNKFGMTQNTSPVGTWTMTAVANTYNCNATITIVEDNT